MPIPGRLVGCRTPLVAGEGRNSHNDPGSHSYSVLEGSCSESQSKSPLFKHCQVTICLIQKCRSDVPFDQRL